MPNCRTLCTRGIPSAKSCFFSLEKHACLSTVLNDVELGAQKAVKVHVVGNSPVCVPRTSTIFPDSYANASICFLKVLPLSAGGRILRPISVHTDPFFRSPRRCRIMSWQSVCSLTGVALQSCATPHIESADISLCYLFVFSTLMTSF